MPPARLLPPCLALALSAPWALVHAAPTALPDLLLAELRRSTGSTGMAAAIVRHGKLAWHGETGFADSAAQRPVTRQTRFRLGSVSKFVTVAMLARLVDQRRIDLDQPVHHYLSAYPHKESRFTVRQLAVHTAGIPHYQMPQDAALDARTAPYTSVGESLGLFQDRPLVHAPGSAFLYSSFGYNLLSRVMEEAAGKPFLRLLDETAALAGTPSVAAEQTGMPERHWSRLYDGAGAELPRQNIGYKWAGGGMLANAPDLALLGAKTLDPAFISRATHAHFTTPARLANGELVRTDRYTMGTGWRLSTDHAGRSSVHHSGVIQGGRANLSVYPDEQAAVSLLANMQATIAAEISSDSLYDAYVRPHARGRCQAGARQYRGRFRDQDIAGTVHFMAEAGLCKTIFSADNPLGQWMSPGRSGARVVAYGAAGEGPTYYVTPAGIFPGTASANIHTIEVLGKPLTLTLE